MINNIPSWEHKYKFTSGLSIKHKIIRKIQVYISVTLNNKRQIGTLKIFNYQKENKWFHTLRYNEGLRGILRDWLRLLILAIAGENPLRKWKEKKK